MTVARTRAVLSIAGSDSGGGAGIQADLKAFAAAGVHGMTAITALTAQSTVGVDAIHRVPGEIIVAQVSSVVADIGVDAVKIGMLGEAETIDAVVEALGLLEEGTPVVVDPVMVAESGAILLATEARRRLVEDLLPLATVVTPNLAEAAALSGLPVTAGQEELAGAVRSLGPGAVIVTGGHTDHGADLLDDGSEQLRIPGPLHPEGAAHGSGCTHSATLAALLARGLDLRAAAVGARQAAARAVAGGLRELGAGAGPVDVLGIGDRAASGSAAGPPPGHRA
jgi:hydroxymethylpyrimidine/phosphomethylpyrimidine kinase